MKSASILLFAACLAAQPQPQFEVATIKPSDPVPPRGGQRSEGNGLNLSYYTLERLISLAYSPELGTNLRIEGGPAWIRKDVFDLVAVAPGPQNAPLRYAMLRELLAERFGLKVHIEAREDDVYALVPARRDGKLGPKVKPWPGTCFGTYTPAAPPGPRSARCAAAFRAGIEITGGTMDVVADTLSSPLTYLGRPVVNRTGIAGEFDMQLDWDYNALDPRNPNRNAQEEVSLFTALQEQWGLKLESAKGTITVLVIDAAHPPTEN